jgi:hypothetical protein
MGDSLETAVMFVVGYPGMGKRTVAANRPADRHRAAPQAAHFL